MSSAKQLLTIFGATGKQGGSVLDVYFAHSTLQTKYALRGITRDPSSATSQALSRRGVDMVKADLNDADSLKAAIKGSYGVFGVTDFWSILDKNVEIQQGKNVFEACKAENVKHLVFSTLPYAEKISDGVLKHVDHFDGKAIVAEYAEKNKGEMIVSYYMPAMYIDAIKSSIHRVDKTPTLSMPFPSAQVAWPLLEPRRDGGKYVMGLFEGGVSANGARVHAVSNWTTPSEVVTLVSKAAGEDVVFKSIPAETFATFMPKGVAQELTETMLLIGEYNYYGKGAETKQAAHDEWVIPDADLISLETFVKENGPWKF